MGRPEMIRKRNTVLKINRKQDKKNQILQRHLEKNTMKYKRPLLKIEQTFDKREKAKHVDKLRTLIHQQVHIKNKFMQKYQSSFFGDQPKPEIQTKEITSARDDLDQEYTAVDNTTNIWYQPSEDALCFHLDSQMQALNEKKIDLATRHVQVQFKESYQSFLTTPLEDVVGKDISLKAKETKPHHKILTDRRDNINLACAKSSLPAEKQTALLSLIDTNQIIVAGTSRDDLNALSEVPLLLLRQCLASSDRDATLSRLPRIICSTPHFLTAQLGAKTVSKLLNDPEYALVELDVGFKQKKCPDISYPPPILFCNNHHLMYYTLDNPSLSQVTHIVLDRAHLRDDMFDVLLLYYKLVLLPKRSDLKLIILTSPMYMDIFARHFKIPSIKLSRPARKSNPVLYLETILKDTGFVPTSSNGSGSDNIKVLENNFYKDYQEKLEKHVNLLRLKGTHRADLISSILNPELEGVHLGLLTSLLTLLTERKAPLPGCILVFLPHDEAIGRLYQTLVTSDSFPSDKCSILKYHSKLTKKPTTHKKLLKQGRTVLILTTDSLESVDHIQGVTHIVDTGHVVRQDYLAHFNIHTSEMDWITRHMADERKTWCEKRNSTKFYRVYTSVRGSHLRGCSTSLLGRIRPDHVVYLLKRLNIQDVHAFLEHLDFKPQHRSICLSIKRFQTLLILDPAECLTPLGFSLSSLPLPPHLTRLAILGAVFSCLDPVLTIVAVLFTQQDPFDETQAKNISSFKSKLSRGSLSDHIACVRALAWYQKHLRRESKTSLVTLCESIGLLYDSLALLHGVKVYLACHLARAGYVRSEKPDDPDVNVNAACERLIETLVYTGLYPNVAVMRSPRKILISKLMKVSIHPSSVYPSSTECNSQENTQDERKFVAYSHCYGTDMGSPDEKIFIRDVTPVPSMAAILFSHDFHIPSRKPYKFSLNEKAFHFRCANEEIVNFIQNLRLSVHQIVENSIVNHSIVDWRSKSRDVQVLRCAIELLNNKDNVCKVATLEQKDLKLKKKPNGVPGVKNK
uniref:ATP-dependent RNA helicase DHX36 n=1 Tax=Cacopsylla melanoneura TaxID=428564 RepID=A0A8D8SP32_9HEMI